MRRENPYLRAGVTVFLTVAAILLFYDTLFASRAAVKFLAAFLRALTPVLYGALMAYLLSPVVDFWENGLFRPTVDRARAQGKMAARGPRAVSLLLTWALVAVAVWLLLSFLLPELYSSIVQLVSSMETYYNTINGWITDLLERNPTVETWVAAALEQYYRDLVQVITNDLVPQAQQLMTMVSGGIWQAVSFLGDLVVGVIVSIYLLATKERYAAHGRKILCGFLSPKSGDWVFRGLRKVDSIFSGFVRGKILDSLIIGVICFVCCRLLEMPYTPLVSVIIGVTNVIPFFGPFLGAIPSLLLILLVSPIKAVYFLIFIIALQQVDGNIIGPRILGDRTGLSGLWVIAAILVGGSFFGVVGMFFGVPVFACLYAFVNFMTRCRLKDRGLPTDTASYRDGVPQAAEPPHGGEKKP